VDELNKKITHLESLDLNITENLWTDFKRAVYARLAKKKKIIVYKFLAGFKTKCTFLFFF